LSLSKPQARESAKLKARIRQATRQGSTAAARRLLESGDAGRLLSREERDLLATEIAAALFQDGQDEAALELASSVCKRSGNLFMEAHWTAGLAAWRLGRYAEAAGQFETVASHGYSSSWVSSAGSFWAARARLAARQPAQVTKHLEAAARYPRTFYGLLALHILDLPMPFKWETPGPDTDEIARVAEEPAGRRALALIQIGEEERAERELRVAAANADGTLLRGTLAVAAQVNMPALASRLDSMLSPRGDGFDGAAFPIPNWQPQGGYTVDRALVFALIRQESGFNPNALSHAGAAGLMQLMPDTASFVAGDGIYRRSGKKQLHDPDLNLRLGQKYMEMLLDEEPVNGDLFLLAAAWNGGPGNLKKWLRASRGDGDPLMFIETIPLRETRIFVERVLANFWIYQHRLGQESPSLSAVAGGAWPAYMPQDPQSTLVARNVKD
jgi:soluble lytic murein transglycosylase